MTKKLSVSFDAFFITPPFINHIIFIIFMFLMFHHFHYFHHFVILLISSLTYYLIFFSVGRLDRIMVLYWVDDVCSSGKSRTFNFKKKITYIKFFHLVNFLQAGLILFCFGYVWKACFN
jgi:hypothetical protein